MVPKEPQGCRGSLVCSAPAPPGAIGGFWIAGEVTPYLLLVAPARWRARGYSGLMNQWYRSEAQRLEPPSRLLMALWDDPVAHLAYRRAAGLEGYRRYLGTHPTSASRPWVPEVQKLWGISGGNLRYAMSTTPDGKTIAVLVRTDPTTPPGKDYVLGGRLHLATWSNQTSRWTIRRLAHLDQDLEGASQHFRLFLVHRPYDFILTEFEGGNNDSHTDLYYRLAGRDLELVERIYYSDDDEDTQMTFMTYTFFYFYLGSLVLLGAAWVLLYIFPPRTYRPLAAVG